MDAAGEDAEMCSGTSSAIFGACFLSITDEPLYLAEMLLHEFCHNKLRLFEDFFGLLLPEASKIPQYYSPWRDDPRPLEGIQHGLFVFGSIAYFWLSICRNVGASEYQMALARRRVATLVCQLKYASEEFSLHATLTEHGQTFLNEMNDWIGDLDVQIEGWDLQDMLPVFSGVMSDKSLREVPVGEALFRHRSNWDCSYGADADGRRS
jgi:HEXXH motif-containing protein